jgi:endogenous inhibitor of DNA gyrase (YacG/DUF329 family)
MTDRMIDVQGSCPACGKTSLFLGDGGHVTCSRIDCPNPSAADQLLHGEQPAPGPAATQATEAATWLMAGTRDLSIPEQQPTRPCPACRRADQAGLAPTEQHPTCAKEQP